MSDLNPIPGPSGQPQQRHRPGVPNPGALPDGHTTSPTPFRASPALRHDSNQPQVQDPNIAEPASGKDQEAPPLPRRQQSHRGRSLSHKDDPPSTALTPEQLLLLLDTWRRSGLPAGDFAALVGISKHTLYAWKRKFETEGPAGLDDKPRGGPQDNAGDVNNAISEKGNVVQAVGDKDKVAVDRNDGFWTLLGGKIRVCRKWLAG